MSLRQKIARLLDGVFERTQEYLSENLPARPKRALMLAHIAGLLYEAQHPDETIVHQVNRLLSMAGSKAQNQAQTQVTPTVWRNTKSNHPPAEVQWLLAQKDWKTLARHLAQTTPAWMHYADDAVLLRDIEKTLALRYGATPA